MKHGYRIKDRLNMQFSLLDFDIEQTYTPTQASFSINETEFSY